MVAVPHDSSHVALYALLVGSEYLPVHDEGLEFRNPKNPFVCLKTGISLMFLFWGWDWNPQSCSREGSGFLGIVNVGKYSIHGTYGS